MNYKKVLAGMMAATMVIGSVTVFASESKQEGNAGGTGTFEGTVDTDVFSVTVPTGADNAFDFILDPEGLIAATDAAHYADATFEEGQTLFFKNDGDSTSYSSKSDMLDIINKSSVPVDVSIKATVTDTTDIKLSDDKTFKGDTDTSIYLAVTDGTSDTVIKSDGGAEVKTVIGAAAEGSYEYKYEGGAYKYELKADLASDDENEAFQRYSFGVVGTANAAGDWSEISESPKISVTFEVTPGKSYVSSNTVSVGSETVTLSLPESVTVKSAVLTKVDGSVATLKLGDTYTVSGTTLGIKATVVSANKGGTIKITYSDEHVDTIKIN